MNKDYYITITTVQIGDKERTALAVVGMLPGQKPYPRAYTIVSGPHATELEAGMALAIAKRRIKHDMVLSMIDDSPQV